MAAVQLHVQSSVRVIETIRFTVLEESDETVTKTETSRDGHTSAIQEVVHSGFNPIGQISSFGKLPTTLSHPPFIIGLEDMLLHETRKITQHIHKNLLSSLQEFGFVILTTPSDSQPSKVIQAMRHSMEHQLFPQSNMMVNAGSLKVSKSIYVSERGVPMYRLGYELSEDHIREVFRIAAGDPDDAEIWPDQLLHENCLQNKSPRTIWLQGIGLMRHITDTALDLLYGNTDNRSGQKNQSLKRMKRPYSGKRSWLSEPNPAPLEPRHGDYSVLYNMHYFNSTSSCNKQGITLAANAPEPGVAVKAHVDPSLFVCEPYLCQDTTGLQVWIRNQAQLRKIGGRRSESNWLDCDGPEYSLNEIISRCYKQNEALLLFVGKGIQSILPDLEPTMHRVVIGHHARKSVIYEQKYEEFFPPPILD